MYVCMYARMFLSCRSFIVSPSLKTEVTSTPTRPVENAITMKGLQYRNIHILEGTTVENKGKTIN